MKSLAKLALILGEGTARKETWQKSDHKVDLQVSMEHQHKKQDALNK